jgi:hypothetical protein
MLKRPRSVRPRPVVLRNKLLRLIDKFQKEPACYRRVGATGKGNVTSWNRHHRLRLEDAERRFRCHHPEIRQNVR